MGNPQTAIASSAMNTKKLRTGVKYESNRGYKSGGAVGPSKSLSCAPQAVAEPSVDKKEKEDLMPRTYRCRLYRLPIKRLAGQQLFTEVWDFEEKPGDPSDLPAGTTLLKTFTGRSISGVRADLDPYRLEHGYILSGDWASKGSI